MWPGEAPEKDSLSEYIQRVCEEIALPFAELAARIKRNPLHLRHELSQLDRVRAITLRELADCLDATAEDLLNRTVPVDTIMLRRRGVDLLPVRYTIGAASKLGNVLPVFKYLDSLWGPHVSQNIRRELNLSPKVFEKPDTPVSLCLISDVMNQLASRGFSEEDFLEMGLQTPKVTHYQKMAQELFGAGSVRRMYEVCLESTVGTYEKNFAYSILRASSSSMLIQAQPRPEIQDAFRSLTIDTKAVAAYRAGITASHPEFLGLPAASIAKRRCMHDGGAKAYVYELTW